MQEALPRLSIAVALAGLLSLFIVGASLDARVLLKDVDWSDEGQRVKACGAVEGKRTSRNGHTFFTLNDNSGKISIVVFNSTRSTVPKGRVCVAGEVNVYRGKLEIIAKTVVPDA